MRYGHLVTTRIRDLDTERGPDHVEREPETTAREAAVGGRVGRQFGDGLLQTPDYARGLLLMRRPAYSAEEVERFISARVARKAVFERNSAPDLSFVLEEWTLRRPLGGRARLRAQLEHLLEIGQLRNVELQVMPMDHEEHAGLAGGIEVLKFGDGSVVGRSQAIANGRPVSEPRQLRILELRYGIIRAQALTPRETASFIEQLLGET